MGLPEMVARSKAKTKPEIVREPELVGSISAMELTDLRARTATVRDTSALADLYRRLLSMAQNERLNYMRSVLRAHQLEGPEEYAINEETGAILKYPAE